MHRNTNWTKLRVRGHLPFTSKIHLSSNKPPFNFQVEFDFWSSRRWAGCVWTQRTRTKCCKMTRRMGTRQALLPRGDSCLNLHVAWQTELIAQMSNKLSGFSLCRTCVCTHKVQGQTQAWAEDWPLRRWRHSSMACFLSRARQWTLRGTSSALLFCCVA